MSWDLQLNHETRDLVSGYSTGDDEIIQRLVTRLNRELGEWFLNINAGIPWYQRGEGLLGGRNKNRMDTLIRKETRDTDGVARILTMNTTYFGRTYSIYMELLLVQGEQVIFTLTEEGYSWQTITA